jgi:hypothetical protein
MLLLQIVSPVTAILGKGGTGCSSRAPGISTTPHQHPPKRPPGLSVPAVEDIVREQGTAAEAPTCDAELFGPCIALLDAAPETVVREPVEDEAPGPVDAAAAPIADPAEEITDVGTLNGSAPQLGAPRMKPVDVPDVEQNVIPLGFPLVAPDGFPFKSEDDGLDEAAGAAATAVPGPEPACGGLT